MDFRKGQWRFKVMGTAAVAASCVWWFILYPDLCFPQDTYEVVCDAESTFSDEDAAANGRNLFLDDKTEMPLSFLDAEAQDKQVVITGRLWEWLQQFENK
ncbi:MAG: hypothetical protein NC318_08170 [Blautia sp.]|nr:hypothetical protein [Lachnoclostridium sp.]MCM1211565.1 hypothetical protein [Blautia sp.]